MRRERQILVTLLAGLGSLALVAVRGQAGAAQPIRPIDPAKVHKAPNPVAQATVLSFRDAKGLREWAASLAPWLKDPNSAGAGAIGDPNFAGAGGTWEGEGCMATADKKTGYATVVVTQRSKPSPN